MEKKTALLVIDVQNVIVQYSYQGQEVVARIADLIARARVQDIPVIYVQHNMDDGPLSTGSPGWQLHAAITPKEGDMVFQKTAADSFYETPLHEELKASGIEELIIVGFQTPYCVDTSARRAVSLGYNVTLMSDCHSTFDGPVLKAVDIIAHHNKILEGLGTPLNKITVKASVTV